MNRPVALLVAALVLLGAGVAAAVTYEDDDRPSEQATASSTTTVLLAPTTTDALTMTTTPAAATTTAAPGRPTTTNTTRRPTTTTSRPTGTTATTVRPTTPTTGSPGPACTPDHLVAAIATDRPSYTPAQVVQVTSTLRNRSSTTCFYNGYRFGITFRNDAGTSYGGVNVIADSFADVPLRPGETLTHTGPWDHRACPEPGCGPLPAGPYYATASWGIAGHTYEVLTSLILS